MAPAIGRPKIATDAFPASAVPITQGAASTSATPIDSAATTRTRQRASRDPTSTEPTAHARPATMTSGTTAGAKPAATAITAPRMATWPAGRLRHFGPGSTSYGATRAARASRSAMNGKAA